MEKQKNERILLSDFAKKYNGMNSKEAKKKYVASHVIKTYCPVIEKKLVLELLLNDSIVIQDNGIQYIDMFLSKINLVGSVIALYTDITMNKDSEGKAKIFEGYDILMESNLFAEICDVIGENELKELTNINKSLMDTFYNRTGSTQAFVANQLDRFAKVFSAFTGDAINQLNTLLQDEVLMNQVFSKMKTLSSL